MSRNRVALAGRVLFGAALIGLGVIPFFTGHLPAALVPLDAGALPAGVAAAGGGLLIAGVLVAAARPSPSAPLWLAALPALALVTVHLPRLLGEPRNPTVWSGTFQVVALIAGALLLLPNRTAGRLLLALALAVFGIQHFRYATFVASLVPAWIPGDVFWVWTTGIAFLAAALSALLAKQVGLSGRLLSLMFLSWLAVIHIPRIAARPEVEPEWTSGLVALAIAGIGLILAEGHRAWRADSRRRSNLSRVDPTDSGSS